MGLGRDGVRRLPENSSKWVRGLFRLFDPREVVGAGGARKTRFAAHDGRRSSHEGHIDHLELAVSKGGEIGLAFKPLIKPGKAPLGFRRSVPAFDDFESDGPVQVDPGFLDKKLLEFFHGNGSFRKA